MPKLKKIETFWYVLLKSIGAVPGASILKSNTKVSQAPAIVVLVRVSTLMAPFPASSAFNRTGVPASGDHTRTDIVVAVEEKGNGLANPFVPTVTPAHSSAKSGLVVWATLLFGSVGSTTKADIFPPKSTSSKLDVSDSNSTGGSIWLKPK